MAQITPNPEVDVKSLKPFQKFIMTIGNLPTSYLESLTYAELVMWFCNYLQETVIPTVNNNGGAIEELQELYVELKSYVENYFDNLDVQEEINKKLDDMVESGVLQEIVADYLNSKAIFGFDNVESMKNSTNLINGSYAQTLGYYEKNDGGGALYKIREITNNDVVDDMFIVRLQNNDLIGELIINDKVNVKQVGSYGDNIHDDSLIFQKALNYCNTNHYNLYIPKGYYILNSAITLLSNTMISIYGENNSQYWGDNSLHATKIITTNGFMKGNSTDAETLTIFHGNIKNIYFQGSNTDNLFANISFSGCEISNLTTLNYKNVFYQSIFSNVSEIHHNQFVSCYESFFNRNSTSSAISDSWIHHNYINGKPQTNACMIKARFMATSQFHDNYVDFFKYILYYDTGLITWFNSYNNIYDYCFRIANRNCSNIECNNDSFMHFSNHYESQTGFTFTNEETTEYGPFSNAYNWVRLKVTNCKISNSDYFFYCSTNNPLNFKSQGNIPNYYIFNNNVINPSTYNPNKLYDYLIYNQQDGIYMSIDNNNPSIETDITFSTTRCKYYNNQQLIYDNILLRFFNNKLYKTDGTEYTQ